MDRVKIASIWRNYSTCRTTELNLVVDSSNNKKVEVFDANTITVCNKINS